MKPIGFLLILFTGIIIVISACNGCGIQNLNENIGKVSKTIKSVDSNTQKVSKGASKFVRHAEQYMDTAIYFKDTSGQWHKK